MGQYYAAVILDEEGQPTHVTRPWDFNNGAKLMEHSWLKNDFVFAVETLLVNTEAPRRLVWAGDYADPEPGTETNLWHDTGVLEPYRPDVPALGEQYNWRNDEQVIERDPEIRPNAWPVIMPRVESYPFLVNWDKKLYIDKREVGDPDDEGWTLHPMPLLTAEGCGRGGGDYRGEDDWVGSWARDHLMLMASIPQGFSQLVFYSRSSKGGGSMIYCGPQPKRKRRR